MPQEEGTNPRSPNPYIVGKEVTYLRWEGIVSESDNQRGIGIGRVGAVKYKEIRGVIHKVFDITEQNVDNRPPPGYLRLYHIRHADGTIAAVKYDRVERVKRVGVENDVDEGPYILQQIDDIVILPLQQAGGGYRSRIHHSRSRRHSHRRRHSRRYRRKVLGTRRR